MMKRKAVSNSEKMSSVPAREDTEGFKRFVRRLAYHEAGHAVVALATGTTLVEVRIGGNGGNVRTEVNYPLMFRAGPIAFHFSCLVSDVAGHVCEMLDEAWKPEDGPFNPSECSWDEEFLVSGQFAEGKWEANGTQDVDLAVKNAVKICEFRAAQSTARSKRKVSSRILSPGDEVNSDFYSLILASEEVAIRLLTTHWEAVKKLAQSLIKRSSGRMTRAQVERLVGGIVPAAPHEWISAA